MEERSQSAYSFIGWTALLVLLWGFAVHGLVAMSTGYALDKMLRLYASLPGVSLPWFARVGPYLWGAFHGNALWHCITNAGSLAMLVTLALGSGLLLVRKLEPEDWKGDVILGASAGAVVGMSNLLFGAAFMFTIGHVVLVPLDDIRALPHLAAAAHPGAGAPPNDAAAHALEARPYLQSAASSERASLLFKKVISDGVAASAYAAYVAFPLAMAIFALLFSSHTLIAGYMKRELGRQGRQLSLGYLEMVICISPLFTAVVTPIVLAAANTAVRMPFVLGFFSLLLAAAAMLGLSKSWPWFRRFPCYLVIAGVGAMFLWPY